MDLHLQKIARFCRFCRNLLDELPATRGKHVVLEVLRLQHPELAELDFSNEDPQIYPPHICKNCYHKCYRWKTAYNKYKEKNRRKSVENREAFVTNIAAVSHDDITTGLVCSHTQDCMFVNSSCQN